MPFEILVEFEAIVAELARRGIDYAVCGGFAVTIHGHVRATRDMDVLIRPEDLDRVREAMRGLGFRVEFGLLTFSAGTDRERRLFRVSKVSGPDLLTLDLLLVTPVLEEPWRTREAFEWRGRLVTTVSRAGLAAMKRLAGRRQDLADLEHLGLGDATP